MNTTDNLSGISDWISSAWGGVKNALGIGQPTAIQGGVALTQAKGLYTYCYQGRTLRKGDRGDWVKILQYLLYLLGYRPYRGENPDGVFGDATKQAVISFQKTVGLIPSGDVGRYTAYYIYKTIEQQTKVSQIVPNLTQAWIQKKIVKNPKISPYVQAAVTGQVPSEQTNLPARTQTVFKPAVVEHETYGLSLKSPIVWGTLLILAALLMMRR